MVGRIAGAKYGLSALLVFALLAGPLQAQEEPGRPGLGQVEFRLAELDIQNAYLLPKELPGQAASQALEHLAVLGLSANSGRVDIRGGRWASLLLAEPLLPGRGKGNGLKWADLGRGIPGNDTELSMAASRAFREWLESASREFRTDTAEVADTGKVTVSRDGALIQIYLPRVFRGVPVHGSYLTATINHGNLTLFGTHHWGDIDTSTVPGISEDAARKIVQAHADPYSISGTWGKTELTLIPTAMGRNPGHVPVGLGFDYRLAWIIRPEFDGDLRHFQALVDAHDGQLLAFEDTNQYAVTQRESKGGVLPVTNDGVPPDGVEQSGWPMPFDNVLTPSGMVTTDGGGNLPAPVDGDISSQLSGQFVHINDNCGAINLSSSGNLDFGTSTGTDCTTPGFGGAGNTHASRTGFHELNRIIEIGQSHLPSNTWLQTPLTANMNINQTCNAFWGGGTVNFYRSGGGCSNTGEIAGVFDHEWGHGLDDNDAIPTISSPSGEGIADIYTALRLNSSCIGRNFRATNCGGFGDPCLNCTGVRDIDYLQRASGLPHDYTWSNANCGSSVHCIGSVYAEAVWSLWKRELQTAPYDYDNNTAHEIVNRLTYIGAGNTGTWFSGGPPYGGCAANSGYLNYLAADDDNGNLADGTPHMTAIFTAFNDQEIACDTPAVQDSGCAVKPVSAPVLTASPLDKSTSLSWSAVAGASSYEVFRTDGVFACDFGKARIGETTGTSFNDSGLQNDRSYSYVVIPKGDAAACFGPASNCASIAPAAGPNLDIDLASSDLTILTGDGDAFIDNCEDATLTFDVNNTGLGSLTNVRITGVTAVSHPATIINTTFPEPASPPGLAEGASGLGSFDFTAGGLAFGDTLEFEVSITADEIFPVVKTEIITLADAESDLQFLASKTWDFESGLDGWTLVEGTFDQRTDGGANGSAGYLASSAFLNYQCDQVRSPVFQLTPASTLALWSNYEIEYYYTQWWDRANVAFFESGARNAIEPDGGRLYNATGPGATCATAGQNGWADFANSWASSSWSASALGAASRAGNAVQLDVAYGTDPAVNGKGFWFDQVTVTDIEMLVADGQSNDCGIPYNQSPNVLISAPANGSNHVEGVSVTFAGTASDYEDGDISANLAWTSNRDGGIGTGATFNTSTLSVGAHTITAEVTDSGNPTANPKAGSDQISITITENQPPVVTITAPPDFAEFDAGVAINFSGTASDPEDGDIGANIEWSSSLDGVLGTGASITCPGAGCTGALSTGPHIVTAALADSLGLAGDDQISVTINPLPTPVDVHVEGLLTGTQQAGGGMKHGTATVTLFTDLNNPAGAGYTVSGNFSGSYDESGVSGVTGGDGVAVLVTAGTAKKGVVVNFCVTDVTGGALPYQPEDNTSPGFACPATSDPITVHVESIDVGTISEGGGNKRGTATVTIFGDNGLPQAGYAVVGQFSGTINGESTSGPGVTGTDGSVIFQTAGTAKGKVNISFCVATVNGGLPYQEADNPNPDFACQ